jgi:hypothetical protein
VKLGSSGKTGRIFDRASQHSLTPHRSIRTKLTEFDQMKRTPTPDPYLKIRMPPVEWLEETFFGPSLVYANTYEREMKNVIKVSDEKQFAKGQSSRDLQVCYDARDVETQFMDAIDSAYSFAFSRFQREGYQTFNGGYLKMETSIQEQVDAGTEVVNAG